MKGFILAIYSALTLTNRPESDSRWCGSLSLMLCKDWQGLKMTRSQMWLGRYDGIESLERQHEVDKWAKKNAATSSDDGKDAKPAV